MTTCARACMQIDRKENGKCSKKVPKRAHKKGRDIEWKIGMGENCSCLGGSTTAEKDAWKKGRGRYRIAIGGWDRQVGGQETNKTKGGNARSTQTSVRKRLENDSTTA